MAEADSRVNGSLRDLRVRRARERAADGLLTTELRILRSTDDITTRRLSVVLFFNARLGAPTMANAT